VIPPCGGLCPAGCFSSSGACHILAYAFQPEVRTLVTRQLAHTPYMAGETFTAADISVTYAPQFAQRAGGFVLGEAEQAYVARSTGRAAYKRAMNTCQATKAWAEGLGEGPF
jgi:glutathione S-transferase